MSDISRNAMLLLLRISVFGGPEHSTERRSHPAKLCIRNVVSSENPCVASPQAHVGLAAGKTWRVTMMDKRLDYAY